MQEPNTSFNQKNVQSNTTHRSPQLNEYLNMNPQNNENNMPNMQQPQCNHQNTLFNYGNQANTQSRDIKIPTSGSFNFNSFDDTSQLKKPIQHENMQQKYRQQNHMNTGNDSQNKNII